jgi:dTDP-4-dehydrorhamnose reductase
VDDLELWGGLECTVNRVGDGFRDQFVDNGHHDRPDDLDRIRALGIRTLRYPVTWERVSPHHPEDAEWGWYDARLARVRQLGIRMIAGLVHHGSGPRYTDLLADNFPTGLARHARAVAERYPWIEDWTPVNEPVTTARFSALYGHWYPHHREERSFWLALLNQIDATRLAMREVRRINPGARLIQTDDLGRTYATAALQEQAAFDNDRRWMSWDLLCGRVTPGHPFWARLCGFGLEDRLRAIADDPCPPDVVGVNHYLTSDRFLDHRADRYPVEVRGHNNAQRFADVEGVRVLQPPPAGLAGVLREAWARYGIPLAVTEVHNGSTREEQLRWTRQAWRTAQALRAEGVDLRAITAWALFGSHGWNTLLTGPGAYEPGAFDVRGGEPRPTALAGLLASLAGAGAAGEHPVLAGEGWWSRPIRLHHAPVPRPAHVREHALTEPRAPDPAAPILIVGAGGLLGGALAAACRHRDLHHVALLRSHLDLADDAGIARMLDVHRPWVVINAAGWVGIDAAEADPAACLRANGEGAASLARLCAERGIPTVGFSSDLVFDGAANAPYTETSRPRPINAYGRSKAAYEDAVRGMSGDHLIVRTAALFSPFDPGNFAMRAMASLRDGQPYRVPADETVSPTYVPDLCDVVLDLATDGATGIWHLCHGEAIGRAEFIRRLASACGLDGRLIRPIPGRDLGRHAARPPFSALASERGQMLPSLSDAVMRFGQEVLRGPAEHAASSRMA